MITQDDWFDLFGPHEVEFGEYEWAIKHPLDCRRGNLLDCPANDIVRSHKPEELGRYYLTWDPGEDIWDFTPK